MRTSLVLGLGLAFAVACLAGEAAQAQQRKTGKLAGKVVSTKKTPNGKNTILEVLAPGEEVARPYRVMYDPKVKGPMPAVLAAVRQAKVGDRVQFDWVDTGEGLAITAFQNLSRGEENEGKEKTKGEGR